MNANQIVIMWVDDEIDLLKPHILFLEQKGYSVLSCNNGVEAMEMLAQDTHVDIVFLDENMPGLSGIDVLQQLKVKHPNLPVVMITKSEEERIMEDALGSNITDYLIKPVNPQQILLCLKKIIDNKRLIQERNAQEYQQSFRNISQEISDRLDFNEWVALYKKLVYWEINLENNPDQGLTEMFQQQKLEANQQFSRFVSENYLDWINGRVKEKPLMSHTVLKTRLFPRIVPNSHTFLFVIDNLRFDQWKVIQPMISEYYRVESEDVYCSILPTSTQYARNALFAGLLPSEIEKKYPALWLNENEDGLKNQYENELLAEYLKRYGKQVKYNFAKVLNVDFAKKLNNSLNNYINNLLNVVVINFVDMLSHAGTDIDIVREMSDDDASYRSVTRSWFEHSQMLEMIKMLAERKVNIVITADHGSIRVKNPVKIVGTRDTSTNLRYKLGKSLDYDSRNVFEIKNPSEAYLPKLNVSSAYVFARAHDYFCYPNNYNTFVNYYNNTLQHGGISMEEMLVPYIELKAK